MKEKKKERVYSKKEILAIFFLIGLFLPLTILLFMIPNSWYSAEGYEDLGIMEFEAVRYEGRGSRHVKHYVIYQALDGSGITLRERVFFVIDAQRAVDNREHIMRHVYRAYDAPNFILRKVRGAGYQIFQEGKEPQSWEEFQSGLDRTRKITLIGKSAGLCYIGAFGAVVLLKRRKRAQEAQN